MAEVFAELQRQDSAAEWLALLIDREAASRETKRFEARMRSARLRHVNACPEDVDYRARRGLDKALFQSLLSGRWITDKRSLIITGPCGVRKTSLGCAVARRGKRGLQTDAPPLRKTGTGPWRRALPRLFRSITKAQLLILDDWGPDRLTAAQRCHLMEIVEERYGRDSTMITSQLHITAWHDVIGEPTFADAILDRIVHNAYRLELEGASMRKTIAKMDDETPQT